ncbi:hypothetical protein [Methylobacterium marchantiae]|uniref:hypothetical protein n=1 Tax=Methylobacterium marchantiae TaxID=600331 RepID=UPI003670543B
MSQFERATKLGQDGYSDARPALDKRPFVNRRTGQVIRLSDGIDPGRGHNPGLSRAMTVVRRVDKQLATAGEAQAREAIAEIWQTSLPAIVSKLPPTERVQLPVAVSRVI